MNFIFVLYRLKRIVGQENSRQGRFSNENKSIQRLAESGDGVVHAGLHERPRLTTTAHQDALSTGSNHLFCMTMHDPT